MGANDRDHLGGRIAVVIVPRRQQTSTDQVVDAFLVTAKRDPAWIHRSWDNGVMIRDPGVVDEPAARLDFLRQDSLDRAAVAG